MKEIGSHPFLKNESYSCMNQVLLLRNNEPKLNNVSKISDVYENDVKGFQNFINGIEEV